MKSKEEGLKDLKTKIAISKLLEEEKMEKRTKKGSILKPMVAACTMLVSLSGIAFAKDISTNIYNNFYQTGNGVGKAISEGYIENTKMNYENSEAVVENVETGEIIEDAQTKVKVSEFIMDNFKLSMTFDVELSEKAQEIIKAEEVWKFNFPDLIISDENNVVLYCINNKAYDEFSKENNLGYSFSEALDTDMLYGSGVNIVPTQRQNNHVQVIYNIYTGSGANYPKSKKLNIKMSKINISKNEGTMPGDEEITLTGDWNFSLDVPEKMYNRTETIYVQKSTTNEDYQVIAATLYDTGLEITLHIKTEKQPVYPSSLEEKYYNSLEDGNELKTNEIRSYISFQEEQTDEYRIWREKISDLFHIESYVTDENGEIYKMTQGPSANGSVEIDENGILEHIVMYDLTKYNKTNEITMYITYRGTEEKIVLELKEDK